MDPLSFVCDKQGSGPPLLLLHGLGHERRAWYPVMAELAGSHRVIAVDLPGCGESPDPQPGEPYDIPALVEALAELCARLGLRGVHIAGNSLGGALALELGTRGWARSVTALAPIGFGGRTVRHRLLLHGMEAATRVPGQLRRAVGDSPPARALARRALCGDPSAPQSREARFNTAVLEAGSPFVRLASEVVGYTFDAKKKVPCPVTVAWGDRDRVLPAWQAHRALSRIPHARQVTLLGCGHLPMRDNPRAVAATIQTTCAAADN